MLALTIWIILFVLLILLSALRFPSVRISNFELARLGNETKLLYLKHVGVIEGLRQVKVTTIVMLMSVISFWQYGWWAVAIMLLTLIVAMLVAHLKFVQKLSYKIYSRYETKILNELDHRSSSKIIKLFDVKYLSRKDQKIDSVDHLLKLIDEADGVLSGEQKLVITQASGWFDIAVKDIMTPAKAVVTIKEDEVLGPLVLDDLHKSGHIRFPVTNGELSDVVGVLSLRELLDVTQKSASSTAKSEMHHDVLLIRDDVKLPKVLPKLMKSNLQFAVIANEDGEAVGIVTPQDALDYLFKQG